MDNMNPITSRDVQNWLLIAAFVIFVILAVMVLDRRYGRFYAECEANNGVVIMTGRGYNMCIKKTAVIDI